MNPFAIRNILDKIEILHESRGLAGRKPGDTFTDRSTGDKIVFDQLQFFPEGGGQFDPKQIPDEVAKVQAGLPVKINWENAAGPRTGGFALATFTQGDKTVVTGTYLQTVKPNPLDNYIPNVVMKKYNFAGKAAEKTQAGLTAQDLLEDKTKLTITSIMNQLANKLGTDNPLYAIAHHVAMGQPLPMEIPAPEGVSFTAFRDYFCEILQPIALQTNLYDGNAGDAAARFLAPEGFKVTLINFDDSKNAGLSDSILELPDGRFVKVSSKGDKGAEASVRNLVDSVKELDKTSQGKKLLKKYDEVIKIVQDVQAAGQAGAPLLLGIKYNIIDNSEAQIIRGLKGTAPVDIKDTKLLARMGLTPKLIELTKSRTTKNPEKTSLYYHLMASIAHSVAEIINEKTNFSDAASTILNNGALVQVYTKANQRGKNWVLDRFQTIYPGTSVTGVMFSAQKNYSSTDIKGNFTFKILRGAKPTKTEPNVDTSGVATPDQEPDVKDFDPDAKGANVLRNRKTGAGRARR